MAVNNITISNTNYGGEVLGNILTQAFLGNEIARKGILHVQPGIEKKFSIPRLRVGSLLQKHKEQPTSDDAKGDLTYDERQLNPEDLMVYTEFNPKSFESVWREFQPTGNMVFYQLPGEVQNKILNIILQQTATEIGNQYINGIYGSGESQFFNGLVARILSDSETVYAQTGATTWVKKFESTYDAIPVEIVDNPNLKFIMNTKDYNAYDAELKAQGFKNVDPTAKRVQEYNGVEIVTLANWPQGLIIATLASTDESSNLWAGVNLQNDENTLQVDKVTAAGERYFVKILLKADTNTAFGDYVVVYDERTADASYITDYSGTATSIATSGALLGATYRYTNNGSSAVTVTTGVAAESGVTIASKKTYVFHFNGTAWI